jgi:hypothetical protein
MWLKARVLTSSDALQSSASLWDVHCADYKNRNKKGDTIDFLAKKYEISNIEVEKKIANLESQFRRENKKKVAASRVFPEETNLVCLRGSAVVVATP